jgi:hypothetical protein
MVEKTEIFAFGICGLIICLLSGFFFVGAWRNYKYVKEHITHECQVHSVNISWIGKCYCGIWSVTVMDNGKKIFDTRIKEPFYICSEEAALKRANKYKV